MTKVGRPISFSVWRKIAMASWRPRKDPAILATMDVDAEALQDYIERVRSATGAHVTPAHLVGRAGAKVVEALPGLNGRVVLGQFVGSATIDCSFVVSMRTDPTTGPEAASTDLSGSVVRDIDRKPPWVIAQELADRAALIRADRDPQFKQTKQLVKWLPPLALRAVTDAIGFLTDGLQLPVPVLGLPARPYGSFLVSNVGTYGLDRAFAPVPPFCHVPAIVMVGAITDRVVARNGDPVVRPMLPLAISLDHRLVDGYQAATMARVFREYLADPGQFDPLPPERRGSGRSQPLATNGKRHDRSRDRLVG
jgi:pyruvate/2-oxoglutarate dehydrogenase complex dihydrolipoamide acyltransferase (E2) component